MSLINENSEELNLGMGAHLHNPELKRLTQQISYEFKACIYYRDGYSSVLAKLNPCLNRINETKV